MNRKLPEQDLVLVTPFLRAILKLEISDTNELEGQVPTRYHLLEVEVPVGHLTGARITAQFPPQQRELL